MSGLSPIGRVIYALAVVGFGVALLRYAGVHIFMVPSQHRFPMNPVFPLPPPVPWLVVVLGVVLIALGLGMLSARLRRQAAPVLAVVLVLSALAFTLPRYAAFPGSVALRTELLEPFTFAAFAVLLAASPARLTRAARIVVGATMVVYGVDHFLLIQPLAGLVPSWIPWHVFWILFFGLAFIAAGVSIGANLWLKWSAVGLGLMFAIFVFILQVPLAMGWLKIPGQDLPADLWSSCLIAVAMWGGAWALVANR